MFIWNKLVNWIKNLFNRPKALEDNFLKQEEVINKFKKNDYKNEEKERIFKLYYEIKNENIDIKTLSSKDIEKIKKLLTEEINLKYRKLIDIKNENIRLENKIKIMKEEKDKLQAQINNTP